MENIYLYGAGKNGEEAFANIKDNYKDDVKVEGFIDSIKTGNKLGKKIFALDEIDRILPVIITLQDEDEARKIYFDLIEVGFHEIWWYRQQKLSYYSDLFYEQCIPCFIWTTPTLEHVEMNVMDGCNLNCKCCSHYSPLFDRNIPNTKRRIADVKKLLSKNVFIENFYFLGGEPFLNPELGTYIKEIRKCLPLTKLKIVTNGILLPDVNEEIFRDIHEGNVIIEITDYPPTSKIHNKIDHKLKKYNIKYYYRELLFDGKFSKLFSLNESTGKYPNICLAPGCINIYEGRIARCPQLMYIDKFNKAFGLNLPNDGIFNLEEIPEGEDLVLEMKKPVSLCKYCIYCETEWEVCNKTINVSDFALVE